jgi:hypothetical protein
MPKLYYPNADELQGATPLDERLWFKRYQSVLLRLVNTNEGRDLLCIDPWRQQPYPIIKMGKNFVRFDMGWKDGRHTFKTDVRVGAKWGNVIRSRWRDFVKALDRNTLLSILDWPPVYDMERLLQPIGGGATTTVYPDPHPEDTTVDGRVAYNASAVSWSTIVAASGNWTSDSANPDYTIYIQSPASGTDTWEALTRAIYLFDTSDIGDDDQLDSAVMSLYGSSKSDSPAIAPTMNVYASTPASNDALVNADYGQIGTTELSNDITFANWSTSGYNPFTLSGSASVPFDGITKLAVRDSAHDAATPSAPSWASNVATAMHSYKAEASGTSTDPKLVIVHTSPFTPKAIMF